MVDPPTGVRIVAELGYPRDLLDRGRVNLVTTYDGDAEFRVISKQLVTDFFEPAAVEERRTLVPTNGQPVALQALFGTVDDCEDTAAVSATLELVYTFGDDPAPRQSSIPLADASVLDRIRAQECTARSVLADNAIEFGEPVVNDETIGVDVTITRSSGDQTMVIDAVVGTVLFGASTEYEHGSPERTLEAGTNQLVIPLVFDVNRCDPHAVAETTKKFGLDFWIAVGETKAQRVPIPLDPILDDLEAILDRCKQRTGR